VATGKEIPGGVPFSGSRKRSVERKIKGYVVDKAILQLKT